jgi:hypothetical protein
MKRIAWRLQAQAEGDLSDRARQRAAELANDADLGHCPPKPANLASAGPSTVKSFSPSIPQSSEPMLTIRDILAAIATLTPDQREFLFRAIKAQWCLQCGRATTGQCLCQQTKRP